MNKSFKPNFLPLLGIVYLIFASLLDKNNILSHIQITLLISALTLKKNGLILFALSSNLLYWLSEYTKFVYIDNLMSTTTIFTILAITISFIHKDTKVFTSENETPEIYLSRVIDFLKVFIVSFIIYLISYSVVYFISVLGINTLDKIATAINGAILVILTHKQILSLKDNKEISSANWLKDFITKVYVPITIGLMSIVVLESLYFLSISKHFLSYEFELGVFTLLIINNILISSFISKENIAPKVNKVFFVLDISIPILLGILMFKHHFDNGFAMSVLYIAIFSVLYVLWKLNKFNKKTFLSFVTILYFFPVVGLVTNPIREAMINKISVIDVLTKENYHNYTPPADSDVEDKNNISLMREEKEVFENLNENNKKMIIDNELEISIEGHSIFVTNLKTKDKSQIDLFNGEYIGHGTRTYHTPILITSKSIIKINYVNIENGKVVNASLQITEIK